MIRVQWDNTEARGDIVRNGGPIDTSDDLMSAVVLSLFTNAPRGGDLLPGQTRGGWWGDRYSENPNDIWGSRIWQRGKKDNNTELLLTQDIQDALAWMTQAGITRSISVEIEDLDEHRFSFCVNIEKLDGTRWEKFWEVTFATA